MSWKCGININEVNVIQDVPVVSVDILKSIDLDEKGWTYDPIRGYSFRGTAYVTDNVVKDGKLTIRFNVVGGHFDCSYCGLTSLEGCPTTVGGGFGCRGNQLTSLTGCPKTVGGNFDCGYNQLTSLKGCPKIVGGWFDCEGNQLTSLAGCPETVGDVFECKDNKVKFTADEVEALCEVENAIYC